MKSTFIALMLAATLYSIHGQSLSAPSAENRGRAGSSASFNNADRSDQLSKAREEEAELLKTYTDQNPNVVNARKRIPELERGQSLGDLPPNGLPSTARYGQRLGYIVRRGDTAPPGSIVLTSAMSQEKLDALSEDLTVLNFIFTRNFERTFGEKGTEYRLGVPITMSGGRFIETSYIEGFGVLVKVHVPFAVVSSGEIEKKTEPAPKTDSDWEKARRALFGGADAEGAAPAAEQVAAYDEKLVGELKRQIFDALKSAANIRNMDANQTITVAIIGGPNFVAKPDAAPRAGGANAARSTVMTIRVTKMHVDAAAKNPEADDLSKNATVIGYFDSANASAAPRGMTTYGGGYGSGFGGGYGSVGAYPSATPAAR